MTTNAIDALFRHELPDAARAGRKDQFPHRAVHGRDADRKLAISRPTEVEVSSLLARDFRMRVIRAEEAREADAFFEDVVRESFFVLLPGADDYALARRNLCAYETGLRAGGALQLAIAGSHQAAAIYSLDNKMIKAGKILGLPVSAGINAS